MCKAYRSLGPIILLCLKTTFDIVPLVQMPNLTVSGLTASIMEAPEAQKWFCNHDLASPSVRMKPRGR